MKQYPRKYLHTYKIYFTDNTKFCSDVSKLCDDIRLSVHNVISITFSDLIIEPNTLKKYSNVTIKTSD